MKRDVVKEPALYPLLACMVYLVWVLATFLLEGRISTLLRPGAVADRILYTVVANILVGIVLALAVLRTITLKKCGALKNAGFQSLRRTLPAAAAGFFLGLTVFLLQHPASTDPVVLLNIYTQVLTVTIAEVIVCWVLVSAAAESIQSGGGRIAATAGALVISGLLFGLSHFAHSPPFNQPAMVVFLSVIGFLTGLVYYIGRDVYATILFHNFLGCAGVAQSLAASGLLDMYSRPLLPVIGMAALSLAVFVLMDVLYVRRIRS